MYGRRLTVAVLLSLAVHVLVPLVVPRQPHPDSPPRPPRPTPRPVPVAVVREVQRSAEAPLPEPPPPPPPPRVPPPTPAQPEKPRKTPPAAPKPPSAPSPAAEPAPRAAPRKPAPFVLSNVALQGTVAVQTGTESNLFGDPSRDATGFQKGDDRPGTEGSAGSGGPPAPEARKPVIRPPRALNQVKGAYPEAHRDLGRVVRIELLLTVGPTGEVTEVKVRKGDLPAFVEEARRTVLRLRFEPATRDGVPISYPVPWTVVFLPEP